MHHYHHGFLTPSQQHSVSPTVEENPELSLIIQSKNILSYCGTVSHIYSLTCSELFSFILISALTYCTTFLFYCFCSLFHLEACIIYSPYYSRMLSIWWSWLCEISAFQLKCRWSETVVIISPKRATLHNTRVWIQD